MFKKLKVILGVSALVALCAGLTACSKLGDVEKYQKEGYDISVTFDASGGKFYTRDGISVVYMYKSEAVMQDGVANIKLTDPTVNNEGWKLTKSQPLSFFAGWYKNREICTSENDKPVDDEGRELVEVDGVYYVAGTENLEESKRIISSPKYIYSDYCDLDEFTFTVNEGAEEKDKSLTLYAGWVPYFSFDYYYEDNGEWVKYATTEFNYRSVNEDPSLSDQNTILLPQWEDGQLEFTHLYSNNNDSFTFPDINSASAKPESLKDQRVTFAGAYADKECTQPITEPLAHDGTFNAEKYEVVNAVKNVYVKYDPYERYIIDNAKQLAKYANTTAHFEITKDLDFTDELWPAVFSSTEFNGTFESVGDRVCKIKNAKATVSGSEFGGLFASVGANAVIKNVTFENATVNLVSSPRTEYSYALFSGNINDKAQVSGVTAGGMLRIGSINVPSAYHLNLFAIGKTDGITNTGVSLQVYGVKLIDTYEYSINAEKVTVDESNGDVTIVAAIVSDERVKEIEFYDIISSWRQNND